MRIAVAVLLAVLGVVSMGSAQDSERSRPSRSTNDAVYAEAQAARGRVLFTDVCMACHPDPFWRPQWKGRPLENLYTTIVKFMPDDNPGTVSGEEAAAVLAYILQSNGAPAGARPLPDDAAALMEIIIDAPPAAGTP